MNKCFICGSEVRWEADFMGEEYGMEFEDGKDRVVSNYTCPECGTSYQVVQFAERGDLMLSDEEAGLVKDKPEDE